MNDDSKRRLPSPPHNPGLRDLVAAKHAWSAPIDEAHARSDFRGWHGRGYLPHRDAPGLTQFVTFRLADSFPAALRSEWEALLKVDEDREQRRQVEAYLDGGRGECLLRCAEVAAVVESAFRFFHNQRYELLAWVIMPNHVQVLFKVVETSMSAIIESWKKFTAHEVNKLLHRSGKFWAEDYWDTYMRSSVHEAQAVRYIESNPVKAKLVREPKDWSWSSAKLRDEFGRLQV